jgi:hypothetical protein
VSINICIQAKQFYLILCFFSITCLDIEFLSTSIQAQTNILAFQDSLNGQTISFPIDVKTLEKKDSQILKNTLVNWLTEQRKKGYLEASIDTVIKEESPTEFNYKVIVHIGKLFTWVSLNTGGIPENYLAQIGYRNRLFEQTPLSYKEVFDLEEKLLNLAENSGYPFAQVFLDSVQLSPDNLVSASLVLNLGRLFLFSNINTQESIDAKLDAGFLENLLDIRPGAPYSKAKVLKISQRIAELPYLSEKRKPTVIFRGNEAIVNLYLTNKKASRWDALIGVLPTTTPNGQSLNITATANVEAYNALGVGERIYALLEQLRPQSPKLDLRFTYPYILNLPYGADISLNIYKQDTTYLDSKYDIGIQYFLGGNQYLKGFYTSVSSSNLSLNKSLLLQTHRLPNNLDVSTNSFGLEYKVQKYDYLYNPRKGFSMVLRGAIGQRNVNTNQEIVGLIDPFDPNFKFSSLYDTVVKSSTQYKFDLKGDVFLPIQSNSTFRIAAQAGVLITPTPIAQNEQYRLGGNRLLRGFDEESIYATRYVVGSLEYRLLIGKNAYLYVFTDQAYIENKTSVNNYSDTPSGYGLGISFETGVGIFGVSFAVGKQQQDAVDFRNIKTHFGYINLF